MCLVIPSAVQTSKETGQPRENSEYFGVLKITESGKCRKEKWMFFYFSPTILGVLLRVQKTLSEEVILGDKNEFHFDPYTNGKNSATRMSSLQVMIMVTK